jgi:hypothetical protein
MWLVVVVHPGMNWRRRPFREAQHPVPLKQHGHSI